MSDVVDIEGNNLRLTSTLRVSGGASRNSKQSLTEIRKDLSLSLSLSQISCWMNEWIDV